MKARRRIVVVALNGGRETNITLRFALNGGAKTTTTTTTSMTQSGSRGKGGRILVGDRKRLIR